MSLPRGSKPYLLVCILSPNLPISVTFIGSRYEYLLSCGHLSTIAYLMVSDDY